MSIDIDPWWERWWYGVSDSPQSWEHWITLAIGFTMGLALGIVL